MGLLALSKQYTGSWELVRGTVRDDMDQIEAVLNRRWSQTFSSSNILGVDSGGTGLSSYTIGDILYASTASTLAKLHDVATGNALISGGVGVAPSWGKIGLTTHVAGILPVANGGLGVGTETAHGVLLGQGTSPVTATAVGSSHTVLHGNTGADPTFSAVDLTADVSGILPYANGGTNASTAWTQGSVIFAGASAFAQDNSNLFWDATNHRLGIGTTSPNTHLEVKPVSDATTAGIRVTRSSSSTQYAVISYAAGIGNLLVNDAGYGALRFLQRDETSTTVREMARFDQIGQFGVGRSPNETLTVQAITGRAAVGVRDSSTNYRFYITETGLVGVNTTGPSSQLDVLPINDLATDGIRVRRSSGTQFTTLSQLGGTYLTDWQTAAASGTIRFQGGKQSDGTTQEFAQIRGSGTGGRLGVGITPGAVLGLQPGNGTDFLCEWKDNGGTVVLEVGPSGKWAIKAGGVTPSAYLQIGAGTATANTAPLKFTSGTLLTSAEAGAIEFLTDSFYATTTTGPTRRQILLNNTDTAFTTGSVPFAVSGGYLSQNNTQLFWDNANNRLGIGINTGFASSNTLLAVYQPTGTKSAIIEYGVNGVSPAALVGAEGNAGSIVVGSNERDFSLRIVQPRSILFSTDNGGSIAVAIDSSGRVNIGNSRTATAVLQLKAGTATASTAPLKFTSGVSLTTAEAGAMEFTTDDLFFTITTGAARKGFILNDGTKLTSGKIPIATTNGRLQDSTAALLASAGVPSVVASTFEKAETGSDANVLTYTTNVSTDEFLVVEVATDISALTGTSVVVTVTWKDSNNATATASTTLSGVGDGTIEVPINAFKSTNVVVSTVFTGVSTAYNISAFITRLK